MTFTTHLDDGGAASSMGDFLINKLLPFMENEAMWVANQSTASLALPEAEVFTHAGTVGSPSPPFFFARTSGDGSSILVGTGTGVDNTEEWYDQPGNPAQSPQGDYLAQGYHDAPGDGTNVLRAPCLVVNKHIVGSLSGHYLFTDGNGVSPGTYVHAAIQVGASEYRHLWIGMMNKFGTFSGGDYLCGHFWMSSTNDINDVNELNHNLPGACSSRSLTFSSSTAKVGRSNVFRASGLRTGVDWWYCSGKNTPAQFDNVLKRTGTVNNGTINVGNGAIVGGRDTLGSGLFMLASNLSARARPLIPFVFFGQFPQDGGEHWGALGQVPDCFRINMRGLAANDSLTIGIDTFRVYPLVNNDPTGVDNTVAWSGYDGIAYKDDT